MSIAVIALVAASLSMASAGCGSFTQVDDAATARILPVQPLPPAFAPPVTAVRYSGLTAEVHVLELVARDDGEVAAIRVAPGQHVRAGDVLVELAARDQLAGVDAAERVLADAERDLTTASQQLVGYEYAAKQYADPEYLRKLDEPDHARVRYAEAAVTVAREDRERIASQVASGSAGQRDLDRALAAERVAEAQRDQVARRGDHHMVVDYMTQALKVVHAEVELASKARDTARAALADAQRALDATRIVATTSGVVADVMVVPGNRVSRDEPVVHLSTWQP